MFHLGYLFGKLFRWFFIVLGIILLVYLCWLLIGGFAVGFVLGCF